MDPEEIAIGEAGKRRRDGGGVVADQAVAVQHQDGAQVLGRGGTIEQEAMQRLRRQQGHARLVQPFDHALQGQVVDVERAADGAGQPVSQIARRDIGRVPGAAPVDPQQGRRGHADAHRDQRGQGVQGAVHIAVGHQDGAPSRRPRAGFISCKAAAR